MFVTFLVEWCFTQVLLYLVDNKNYYLYMTIHGIYIFIYSIAFDV